MFEKSKNICGMINELKALYKHRFRFLEGFALNEPKYKSEKKWNVPIEKEREMLVVADYF